MTQQYPEWQRAMREAQAKRNAQQQKDYQIRKERNWAKCTDLMDKAGIDFYPDEMPGNLEWEYEGYWFQCREEWSIYSSRRSDMLVISNAPSTNENRIEKSIHLKNMRLHTIADAIDYIEDRMKNPSVEEPEQPKSIEEQLVNLIRDLVYQSVCEMQG